MSRNHSSVAIIGSGPAGLTAAVYAARANLAPVVFAGGLYGGQLMLTTEVENYPGFPQGIMGPELMENFRLQAERFGSVLHFVDVTKADFKQTPFRLWTEDDEYTADTVIVATGASARWLDVPHEARLRGPRRVDMRDLRPARSSAKSTSSSWAAAIRRWKKRCSSHRFGSKVTVIHRRSSIPGEQDPWPIACSRTRRSTSSGTAKSPKCWARKKPRGLGLRNIETGATSEIAADALFIAIGHDPNTALFKGQIDLDPMGYIVSADGVTTNIPGIFVAGDVFDVRYKQAITAAGSGCKAALEVEKYLEAHEAKHTTALV